MRERSGSRPDKKQHAAACRRKHRAKHESWSIAAFILPHEAIFEAFAEPAKRLFLGAHHKTNVELRVGVNVRDQMMLPGPTKVLLETEALFASANTHYVERRCVSNSCSGVRYGVAAAAGDFQ
jgi:hypothetical protein